MKSKHIPVIKESLEELYDRFKSESNVINRDRLHLLYILKRENNKSLRQIALDLGRDRSSIYNWLSLYKDKGLEAYITPRKYDFHESKLRGHILESLKEKLDEEKGFSSYGEIVEWLKSEHNLIMKYKSVYHIVRYKLKAKLKVARPVNIKKDPKKEEEFKKKCQK